MLVSIAMNVAAFLFLAVLAVIVLYIVWCWVRNFSFDFTGTPKRSWEFSRSTGLPTKSPIPYKDGTFDTQLPRKPHWFWKD